MKGRRMFILIAVCAGMNAGSPPPLFGQGATGTIRGVLVKDGKPNANARVSILYYAPKPVESVAFSDANGVFSVAGMPVGKTLSVVVYDGAQNVIGKGSGVIAFAGETITVYIEAVPVVRQGG
jgi:hypothetical protein